MRPDPNPHAALALAAAAVVALEAAFRTWESIGWLLAQALVVAVALVLAWRAQDRLRLAPVLVIVGALHLALLLVHTGLEPVADRDSSLVFRWQGNALLRGDYPRSEYPVGAVLLFAVEAWLGGGSTRFTNGLLMIPFALAAVAAVWLTRARSASGPWLATLVAVWPLNAYHWQYKYDLAPAALLALGLLFAWRERWALSGVLLGLGAAVKWSPGLAAVVLAAWLLASRRTRDALAHVAAAVAVVALVHLPFLLTSPSEVAAAYTRQTGRSITPESVWYLLLRPFDLARVRTHISFSAGAPAWANVAAVVVQLAALAAIVAAAVAVRRRLRPAVALAAAAPAAFLLLNRIFSPQFVLVLFAAWAVMAALAVRSRREQLAVGAAMCAAASANAFVYPYALPRYALTWPAMSAVLFALGLGLTAWLATRAVREPSP